jgi:hypothetical protein
MAVIEDDEKQKYRIVFVDVRTGFTIKKHTNFNVEEAINWACLLTNIACYYVVLVEEIPETEELNTYEWSVYI